MVPEKGDYYLNNGWPGNLSVGMVVFVAFFFGANSNSSDTAMVDSLGDT